MTFNAYRYKIPFTTPLETSQKTFSHRHGLLLEVQKNDRSFYGEAAPLPGFSKESLAEVIERFRRLKGEIAEIVKAQSPIKLLNDFHQEYNIPSSLAFGIDTLAYKIAGHREGKSLQEFLFPEAPTEISVNALVSLSSENLLQEVQNYTEEGFSTIKFKIGMDFEAEYKQLQKVRAEFPDLTLRLDANKAWSLEESLRNCSKLASLDIEYCEEPLRNGTPSNFEKLYQNTELPLAIDESLIHSNFWKKLLPFTSHIIIKPMILGSFTKLFETNRLANTLDNKIIFTTSLEGGIGRRATAVLASGLGATQVAHGLATGKFLANDFHPDKGCILQGTYELNNVHDEPIIISHHLQDLKLLE